ncbi:hypothetical protein GJ629_04750 [Halapricum sp. CBA1109]|uniref:hypothetical protein n=1 Tax=Halapricum sp. CBA1109 TaxID=2668068 RepID=UPI0012FBAEBE|nr:hypothetical protein [Halapricum sp. CBA1109]MUV89293.1 hypothetical protein [Halapricum sp. CBA1109]
MDRSFVARQSGWSLVDVPPTPTHGASTPGQRIGDSDGFRAGGTSEDTDDE